MGKKRVESNAVPVATVSRRTLSSFLRRVYKVPLKIALECIDAHQYLPADGSPCVPDDCTLRGVGQFKVVHYGGSSYDLVPACQRTNGERVVRFSDREVRPFWGWILGSAPLRYSDSTRGRKSKSQVPCRIPVQRAAH